MPIKYLHPVEALTVVSMQTRSIYVEGPFTARGHFRSRYSFEIEFLKTIAWNVKTQHKTKPKQQFLYEI